MDTGLRTHIQLLTVVTSRQGGEEPRNSLSMFVLYTVSQTFIPLCAKATLPPPNQSTCTPSAEQCVPKRSCAGPSPGVTGRP